MPHRLKIRAPDTDARLMSETALTPPDDTTPTAPESLVTGDGTPRLGSTPITPPAPMGGAGVSVFDDASAAPTLPVVSPVLRDPNTPMQPGAEYTAPAPAPVDAAAAAPTIPTPTVPAPVLPAAAPVTPAAPPTPAAPAAAPSPVFGEGAPSIPAPSLPTAAPTPPPAPPATDESSAADPAGDAEHPMAHLMGDTATKPSEASKRAAQLRAEKKAKAKKMKISFAVGAVVVSAVAGPPLWSWFTNALDEVGTSTEQPAD